MTNKEIIKKLRDNAELAWASYGYFHYFLEKQNKSYFIVMQDEQGNEIRDTDNKLKIQEIYITDILNAKYKNHRVVELVQLGKEQKEITIGTLDGDFGKEQAQRFFFRYELVHHIPDIASLDTLLAFLTGYSATLFYDTDTQNYIIAFRGTENTGDYIADIFLALAGVAITQIIAMSSFAKDIFETIVIHHQKLSKTNNPNSKEIACKYNSLQSIREYFNTHNINVIVTGHSLGGHLAQVLCIFHRKEVKELYTYNAPGMGGIVASALVIFLRVIRIIWKLLVTLVKSIAKLFNPNGFTRKVLDKSLQASGYEAHLRNVA